MSTDQIKRYYGKIKSRFDTVNKQNPFFDSFKNAIESGENTFFQKHLLETRVFDGTWVDFIESNLVYLDNIVRNPRTFIKSVDEVVPVERAKKTTSETVRYLASHSHHIRDIDERGEVVPKKLLTVFREEDIGIYENRFIKSLVQKLVVFVEKRYNVIKDLIGTDYVNKFYYKSKYDYDNTNINMELNISVTKKINYIEAEQKNHDLLERVELLRQKIMGFMNSQFFQAIKSVRLVAPPIQKTNILTKDPNYKKCYEIWLFLDSYGKLDYTLETSTSDSIFNEDYLNSLYELNLYAFATVAANNQDEHTEFKKIPNIQRKVRKPKILNSYDSNDASNNILIESHLINEYYYQQSRRLYSQRIDAMVNDGEPFHAALEEVYKSAFEITERIFNDLMEIPDEVKLDPRALLKYRIRNQRALEQIYRYKANDLAKMEKAKIKNASIIEKEKAILEGNVASKGSISIDERNALKIKELTNELKLREKELAKKTKEYEKEKAKLDAFIVKEKERINKIKAKEKERLAKEKEKQKKLEQKLKVQAEREARRLEREAKKLEREKKLKELVLVSQDINTLNLESVNKPKKLKSVQVNDQINDNKELESISQIFRLDEDSKDTQVVNNNVVDINDEQVIEDSAIKQDTLENNDVQLESTEVEINDNKDDDAKDESTISDHLKNQGDDESISLEKEVSVKEMKLLNSEKESERLKIEKQKTKKQTKEKATKTPKATKEEKPQIDSLNLVYQELLNLKSKDDNKENDVIETHN